MIKFKATRAEQNTSITLDTPNPKVSRYSISPKIVNLEYTATTSTTSSNSGQPIGLLLVLTYA